MDDSDPIKDGPKPWIRGQLRRVRSTTAFTGRLVSRLNTVTRYAFNLVLWSRIAASGSELARRSATMTSRGIRHAAPSLFLTGDAERAAIWEAGFDEIYRLLLANLQTPDLISRCRYAVPSPAFQGVYLWDSAFIAQVWKHWDPAVALDCCLAVTDLAEPDGRLPHVTAHFVKSPFTQPPLIAWSLLRTHRWADSDSSLDALRQTYPRLQRYAAWLDEHRRLPNGLYFWQHPYESGVENAPRFSSQDERHYADTSVLAAPDLSAWVALQSESLAEIARLLDYHEDADQYQQRYESIKRATETLLWYENDRLYYDRHARSHEFVRSSTVASLLPLIAGIPSPERAAALRDRIHDPSAFGTLIPLPSVARDDRNFAKDMWRGGVWINTAYAVLLGLERYGFRDAAAEVAHRLADGVYRTQRNNKRVFEFYDPDRFDIEQLHRKRGNYWKRFTLGDKPRSEFVGWSGLVNTIVIEHIIGLRHEQKQLTLRPNVAPDLAGCGIAVRLPASDCSVYVVREQGGRIRGDLSTGSDTEHFEIDAGECFVARGIRTGGNTRNQPRVQPEPNIIDESIAHK